MMSCLAAKSTAVYIANMLKSVVLSTHALPRHNSVNIARKILEKVSLLVYEQLEAGWPLGD